MYLAGGQLFSGPDLKDFLADRLREIDRAIADMSTADFAASASANSANFSSLAPAVFAPIPIAEQLPNTTTMLSQRFPTSAKDHSSQLPLRADSASMPLSVNPPASAAVPMP